MAKMNKSKLYLFILIYTANIFFSGINNQLAGQDFLFFNRKDIEKLKNALDSGEGAAQDLSVKLKMLADSVFHTGPFSITYHASPSVSDDFHDYYSEGPYWWPDPDDPDAPYVRRDGERNPERFLAHKTELNSMYSTVFNLSLAGYLWENPDYSERARQLIRIFFIERETRMNPHLSYAQAIPNRSPGRGVGIIETRHFIKLLEAVNFLKLSGSWNDQTDQALKKWFSRYLNWLLESPHGVDEKKQGNNHSSWWGGRWLHIQFSLEKMR